MKKTQFHLAWILLALLALAATACSKQFMTSAGRTAYLPMIAGPQLTETYTDPFSYCAAIGMVAKPEEHYVGDPVPDAIVEGYVKASALQNTPELLDQFKKTTIWRCMNSLVYACNFGANLPCDSQANADKTPTQEMTDYCKQNKNADFIPMSVTGHNTIYSWRCKRDKPAVDRQVNQVDEGGFISEIWYKIEQ